MHNQTKTGFFDLHIYIVVCMSQFFFSNEHGCTRSHLYL